MLYRWQFPSGTGIFSDARRFYNQEWYDEWHMHVYMGVPSPEEDPGIRMGAYELRKKFGEGVFAFTQWGNKKYQEPWIGVFSDIGVVVLEIEDEPFIASKVQAYVKPTVFRVLSPEELP